MLVHIQRLWQGKYASLRSYQVNKALLDKEDLEIALQNGGRMIIPYAEITKRAKWNIDKFKSKFDGEYTLVDFEWLVKSEEEQAKEDALKYHL